MAPPFVGGACLLRATQAPHVRLGLSTHSVCEHGEHSAKKACVDMLARKQLQEPDNDEALGQLQWLPPKVCCTRRSPPERTAKREHERERVQLWTAKPRATWEPQWQRG